MAATMNPANHYRDPMLDDPTPQPSRSRQNGTTSRKNTDQEYNPAAGVDAMKDAGRITQNNNGPVGPPISYRGVGANADPRLHKSFSQRAKGRPFADEAFANDDVVNDWSSSRPQRSSGRSLSANHPPQNTIQSDSARSNGRATQAPVQQNQRSKNGVDLSNQTRSTAIIGNEPSVQTPTRVPGSAAHRDAANQTEDPSKNWASDRSPLQTLEVKLTDISKEEKRARVQEAEMRLRESQASQGPRRSQRSVSQPSTSTSQPPRTIADREPQTARPAANRVDPDVKPRSSSGRDVRGSTQKRAPLQGPVAEIPVRQHGPVTQRSDNSAPKSYNAMRIPSDSQQRPSKQPSPITPTRQVADNVSAPAEVRSEVPRSASLQQRRPQGAGRVDDRPITERERNASHQAALQQLTGQAAMTESLRDSARNSRKSQPPGPRTSRTNRSSIEPDSPVPVDIGTMAGNPPLAETGPRTSQSGKMRSTQPDRAPPVVGLGVQSPPSRSVNSQSFDNVDPGKGRQRKSSVSFKEPFDKRRPVDEWKSAGTARLTADDFLTEEVKAPETYKAWWEQDQGRKSSRARGSAAHEPPTAYIDDQNAVCDPPLHLKCGPLLRYTGLSRSGVESESGSGAKEVWRGTVMIVTQDSRCSYNEIPMLRLFSQPKKLLPPPPALVTGDQLAPEYIDPIAGLTKLSRAGRALYVRPVDHLEEEKDLSRLEDDTGLFESSPSPLDVNGSKAATAAATNKRTLDVDGERLGRYKEVRAVRIYADPDRDVTFWRFNIEVELGPEQQHIAYRINKGASVGFWVPARGKTMNIMFHSCNGFSLAVDPNTFSGPDPLWRDVLNNHQTRPFHVMIGGGDQIYNDRVMVDTQHFGEWTSIRNPHHKHQAPFTYEMKNELETFYLERYAMWFSQGLFAMANASIPMVNIWDDHDIIDGFGSYPDDFMRTPVFSGLGEIAHKYYLLFQHHTIDAMTEKEEPSWILGKKPGPYIQKVSRSVYLELGQSVAFLGLDARTERTRDDILSIDTLELILERCRREMIEGRTKHLIILLGVPIAYPRLVWLENILTSKALDPIKALHRAGIVKTKLLNRFDGGVEILDDLDDHWTASHHKDERNILIQDLQDLAAEKSARITILSGDVHLAAVGQFYSNPKLKVPKDKDHRYMPNIISSAIVNTPPPDVMADVINKRNKVHHLDRHTDENMIPMFTHDVNEKKRNNTRLLPRRNWCSIREYIPGETPPPSPSLTPSTSIGDVNESINSHGEGEYHDEPVQKPQRRLSLTKTGFNPRNLMRRLSSRGAPPNSYRANTDSGQFQQRAASLDGLDRNQASYSESPQLRASSADHIAEVPALRPSFHRRPTNLSEKAAKKGIVPGVDDQGNEVDFNNHINLEGGLDIVLNCEINQKDPAGITTPYRLLVPALWYDGSSDREKLNAAPQVGRRNTFLQKFGINPRRSDRASGGQEHEQWDEGASRTESYSGSEEEHEQSPKKKFSFFGNRRKKQHQQSDPMEPQHMPAPPNYPIATGRNQSDEDGAEVSRDGVHPNSRNIAQSPDVDETHEEPLNPRYSRETKPVSHHQQSVEAQMQRPLPASSSRQSSQRSSRPLSYVISGAGNRPSLQSEYSSTQAEGRPPYDPDAAYVSGQHRSVPAAGMRQSGSQGQRGLDRPASMDAAGSDSAQPPSRQLRGNGIIGKDIPPTSFRNNNVGIHYGGQQEPPRGYSGIEAYKDPKPRRKWSLRERARTMIDNFEARRNAGRDDWYSDEEEEEYWEGPPPRA